MATPFQILADSGVPLLVTGSHAVKAHGAASGSTELECAITAANEARFAHYVGLAGWNMVYRTQFFAKYRLLSTGNPEIKVLFLDPTTFERLLVASSEFTFDSVKLRVPALIHVIAMKLQAMKNEPQREREELPQILALLHANSGALEGRRIGSGLRALRPARNSRAHHGKPRVVIYAAFRGLRLNAHAVESLRTARSPVVGKARARGGRDDRRGRDFAPRSRIQRDS